MTNDKQILWGRRGWAARPIGRAVIILGLVGAPLSKGVAGSRWQVDGPRISLRDLIPTAPKGLDLGPAARPGGQRRIDRKQVLALLSKADSALLTLPEYWLVETKSQKLNCEDQVRRVTAALKPQLATGLKVLSVRCLRPLTLPAGTLDVRATLQKNNRLGGSQRADVTITRGQWTPHRGVLAIEIGGTLKVAVATRHLLRGEALVPETLTFVSRAAKDLPADVITTRADFRRALLKQALSKGAILRRGILAPIPVVKRDARVTIALKMSGLRLTSPGTVRQAGGVGDWVSVRCATTKRLLKARVMSSRLVEIEL